MSDAHDDHVLARGIQRAEALIRANQEEIDWEPERHTIRSASSVAESISSASAAESRAGAGSAEKAASTSVSLEDICAPGWELHDETAPATFRMSYRTLKEPGGSHLPILYAALRFLRKRALVQGGVSAASSGPSSRCSKNTGRARGREKKGRALRILELGVGGFSTRYLREEPAAHVLSLEGNATWARMLSPARNNTDGNGILAPLTESESSSINSADSVSEVRWILDPAIFIKAGQRGSSLQEEFIETVGDDHGAQAAMQPTVQQWIEAVQVARPQEMDGEGEQLLGENRAAPTGGGKKWDLCFVDQMDYNARRESAKALLQGDRCVLLVAHDTDAWDASEVQAMCRQYVEMSPPTRYLPTWWRDGPKTLLCVPPATVQADADRVIAATEGVDSTSVRPSTMTTCLPDEIFGRGNRTFLPVEVVLAAHPERGAEGILRGSEELFGAPGAKPLEYHSLKVNYRLQTKGCRGTALAR